MNLDDATKILARLKAAFPVMSLDEEQAEVLLKEVALLHDPSVLDEAVTNMIQREERFPSIARIRTAYRFVNDARREEFAALRRAEPDGNPRDIPEWVHVWRWRSDQTMLARQAANTKASGPIGQRNPVKMRTFPHCAHLEPNSPAYSWEEYKQLEREWVEAGSRCSDASATPWLSTGLLVENE